MSDVRGVGSVDRPIARSALGRLVRGQTAIDFVGQRRLGGITSGVLILVTVISLFTQGLNLGIDFKGGVSWDVPAEQFTVSDAEQVLGDAGISTQGARLQERTSDSGRFIKVQVEDQPEAVRAELREAFAAAAGVELDDISVSLVSSSWGAEVTGTAVRALVIFLVLVAVFISFRFEWRMAVASIASVIHDVVISVGVYSVFQFVVTPPTVIAFLTILGYSLYDTVVVFDRIKENAAKYAAQKPPYDDVVNVSINQVLMRTLLTTTSSIVPVLSLLVIGAGVLGQGTLAEFALALFIGMVAGAYSSLYVAGAPLGLLKQSDKSWEGRNIPRAVGEVLRDMVMGGGVGSRRDRAVATGAVTADDVMAGSLPTRIGPVPAPTAVEANKALSHPPRPRKKKRR